MPFIPHDNWLCRRCQFSPSSPVRCALCPFTSGAFKQTSDNRWVHVICALHFAEASISQLQFNLKVVWFKVQTLQFKVHFANITVMEPVEEVDFAIERRSRLKCCVCKRAVGACLQCSDVSFKLFASLIFALLSSKLIAVGQKISPYPPFLINYEKSFFLVPNR